ncbi:MAG TPA: helix-turn-helix transcriptional regulator [Alphaproteobacteria bacterium]|nr:helix-turn-helix transcriptional regulator [Alphaproteobacteria bacterium]
MALFFDQEWFDARLGERGLNRLALSAILGVSMDALDDMWKDQREITPREVKLLAEILGVTAQEIAERGGVSTPVPATDIDLPVIVARLEALERAVAEIQNRMK